MTTIAPFLHLTDNLVIEKVINGEVGLFEILIRRYNSCIYKIGRSYGFVHHDVEDLMQETFILAFQNLHKFEHRSAFKTWLVRIMLNECYRKGHRAAFVNEITTGNLWHEKTSGMFEASGTNDTERTVRNRELNAVIENALNQIPPDYRMVFALREINGFSVSETATALDITETNVKARLNRAKAMLRKQVEGMYSREEIFQFNLIYCDRIVLNVMARINKMHEPGTTPPPRKPSADGPPR